MYLLIASILVLAHQVYDIKTNLNKCINGELQ